MCRSAPKPGMVAAITGGCVLDPPLEAAAGEEEEEEEEEVEVEVVVEVEEVGGHPSTHILGIRHPISIYRPIPRQRQWPRSG